MSDAAGVAAASGVSGADEDLRVAVLAGTTRPLRRSFVAAQYIARLGNEIDGITTRLADPVEFEFPGDGNDPEGKDPRYTELTEWAEAFLLVVPEYNHSFPGSLKRMLDSELATYIHKPVALAGVSAGMFGGVRAIESMLSPLREMGLVVTFTDIYLPRVQTLFDDAGDPTGERTETDVRRGYAELAWMGTALRRARAEQPRAQ